MSKSLSLAGAALLASWGLSPSCVSVGTPNDVESETARADFSAIHSAILPGPAEKVSFTRHVKPVLEAKCLACHSGAEAAGGYRLDQRQAALMNGYRGARIAAWHPERSLLLDVAGTHRNVAVMPPVGNRLSEGESQLLKRWITEGAPWPEGIAGQLRAP